MGMSGKTRHPGIYRRKDGRYRIRATAKCGKTGKRKDIRRVLDHGVGLKEAIQILQDEKQRIESGESRETDAATTSVNDFAVQWLRANAKRRRPGVNARYEIALGLHILPFLGAILLTCLTREDIEAWVRHAEERVMEDGRPYAPSTVKGWWRVLRAMINDAVAQYRLPYNPMKRVSPPSTEGQSRRERRTLSGPELGDLLDAAKQFTPQRYPEIYVMAFTGMRPGEMYAMTWKDLDEGRGRILINKSVWRGHVRKPKTEDPREVALPAEMSALLREHRTEMVKKQHVGLDSGLVFPADNGTHRSAQSLYKSLSLAAEAAGLDIRVTPQVLRRTFNTQLVEAGVDRIVLRSQMGHGSEEMTGRYSGVKLESKHAAVAKLIERTKGDSNAPETTSEDAKKKGQK